MDDNYRRSYQQPELWLVGSLDALTASGSGTDAETTGDNQGQAKKKRSAPLG